MFKTLEYKVMAGGASSLTMIFCGSWKFSASQ